MGPRRSHQKSKKGCSQCKTRRIKVWTSSQSLQFLLNRRLSAMKYILYAKTVLVERSNATSRGVRRTEAQLHRNQNHAILPTVRILFATSPKLTKTASQALRGLPSRLIRFFYQILRVRDGPPTWPPATSSCCITSPPLRMQRWQMRVLLRTIENYGKSMLCALVSNMNFSCEQSSR